MDVIERNRFILQPSVPLNPTSRANVVSYPDLSIVTFSVVSQGPGRSEMTLYLEPRQSLAIGRSLIAGALTADPEVEAAAS